MVSPLRKQRDAILLRVKRNDATANAAASIEVANQALSASADSLHIKLVEFEQDKLALKEFTQIAQKVNHKREVLIPKYKPMVEAYLEAGEAYQNPIFTDLIVWMFDAEELDTAIDWCIQAIEKGLPTPENFKRPWPEVCADFVLEWAEKTFPTGNSIQPYFNQVLNKIESDWAVNEKLHAKWLKFAGYALLTNEKGQVKPSDVGDLEKLESALAFMTKAHELHNKVGVTTKIKEVQSRINAIQEGKNL
ncbi:putative terminase, endonuclease subunit [Vibrio orientalis CIP 102891 = ATCC 33934]|uniref:Probable terminase endonuclease subunit n=1 Tax=Vibrio orientalis CIP 102891 = ATCC 33934 TaxID=675816 RepID=C9QG05_VIBOR|nr:phage terminase small subunit [Vibrio orientalis]EEX94366.1 probable terminase endonuclease subunit [Vibrio orientalis CIP 102891 = ATCC 33934]EGU54089.1 putative terminase, endonuclease subunit [Vibrio orientalis CIP 102891 = ATCC 33934]